ncbi:AAA family ATPase [Dankookia sp. P2]|uniref:AAA family ATPase n=1 Tax=Dankookia sp. P2 TaxID=3423955 RepID=UPI003D66BB34
MSIAWHGLLSSIDATEAGLQGAGYIANRQISTALYLAHHLRKPILVEGPAGVGKTELAKAAASWLGLSLIRMQCYEGLDESKALYEWKYGKQLLYTQILKDRLGSVLGEEPGMEAAMRRLHGVSDLFFSEEFLEPRPLLRALREPGGAVLLIDEVDKADQESGGLPARAAVRLPGQHPGDRHGEGRYRADRAADLQFHARPWRCA